MIENKMRIGGGLVITQPCSATNRDELQHLLDNYGLGQLMPPPTTPMAALKAAMTELYPSTEKGVKHRCDPYTNCDESSGYKIGSHNPKDYLRVGDEYTKVVAIGVLDEENSLTLHPYDYDMQLSVHNYMRHVIEYVPAGIIAKLIAEIIETMNGNNLVKTKPVYWINEQHMEQFKAIGKDIEAASSATDKDGKAQEPTKIHVFSMVADEYMLRAVLDMVTNLVNDKVEQIEEEVSNADMTPQKCQNRITKSASVLKIVKEYEETLATPLNALRENVQKAAVAAATAQIQLSASGGAASLF